jgi:NADH-quinone oxidoreductase subunit M
MLSVLPLALAGYMFVAFEPVAGYQFVERATWYADWGISWYLGVDGISMPLVVLTALLVPIALAASTAITERSKEFVLTRSCWRRPQSGSSSPWTCSSSSCSSRRCWCRCTSSSGSGDRSGASTPPIKFFLYTAFGSALLLAGVISLSVIHASQTGAPSFALDDLMALDFAPATAGWLFAAFLLAFAIKVPVFPLHTWLPDAHVEAPTAGSVLLAGVLLKLGTYGLMRFNLSLFPQSSVDWVPVLAVLAVVGIVYGAVVAIVQPNLKKLIAYTSVSHLGFILLGTFALTSGGLQGAVIQNVNHGLTTGALFLLVGMIYDRRHTKMISDFGGLQKVMPIYAGFFLFMTFASIGLPGLNGFVGEFLVLVGSYPVCPCTPSSPPRGWCWPPSTCCGPTSGCSPAIPDKEENKVLSDLSIREIGILAPLAVLVLHPRHVPQGTARQDRALDRGHPRPHRGHHRLRGARSRTSGGRVRGGR